MRDVLSALQQELRKRGRVEGGCVELTLSVIADALNSEAVLKAVDESTAMPHVKMDLGQLVGLDTRLGPVDPIKITAAVEDNVYVPAGTRAWKGPSWYRLKSACMTDDENTWHRGIGGRWTAEAGLSANTPMTTSNDTELTGPALAAVYADWLKRDGVKAEEPADNPDADGTDFAHPAWWRGHYATVAQICQHVNSILDGKHDGAGVANEPWEQTRRRLLKLTAERDDARRKLAAVVEAAHALKEEQWSYMTPNAPDGPETPHTIGCNCSKKCSRRMDVIRALESALAAAQSEASAPLRVVRHAAEGAGQRSRCLRKADGGDGDPQGGAGGGEGELWPAVE